MTNKALIVLTCIFVLSLVGCLRSTAHYIPRKEVHYYETSHHTDIILNRRYVPSRLASPCQIRSRLSHHGYPHQVMPSHLRGHSGERYPVQRHPSRTGRILKTRGKR